MKQPNTFHSLWIFLPVLLALLCGTSVQAQDPAAPSVPAVSAPAAPTAPAPATPAPAPAPKLDKGDNAWMLTSSALVLMMTIPGLFLF